MYYNRTSIPIYKDRTGFLYNSNYFYFGGWLHYTSSQSIDVLQYC